MQEKFYVVSEFRSNYSQWVSLFKGYEKQDTVFIGNGNIKVDVSVFLDRIIMDKEVNNFDLENTINMSDDFKKIGYDGKRIWHKIHEITEEEAVLIMKEIEKENINYEKINWDNRTDEIKKCTNVYDYMKKYNFCINIMQNSINNTLGIEYMSKTLLKAIKEFQNNMHKIAIETNEKQCIFLENGRIDENKGMRIIREYIFPNGEIEKINGWEYELDEKNR